MSYDLKLYRKNRSPEPLNKEELEPLKPLFRVFITAADEKGKVKSFEVASENEQGWVRIEFCLQDDGSYWTYISYGGPPERFATFKREVKDVAIALGLQIQDPQLSSELVDPENYDAGSAESAKRFNYIVNEVLPMTPHMIPATSKYFIKYFIKSKNPTTSKEVILTLGNNRIYASKVNVGESLLEVINREIVELTGSKEYKLVEVVDNYDSAFDRYGNRLPRSALFLEVPYFDPKTRRLRYPMEWVEPPSSPPQAPPNEKKKEAGISPVKDHNEEQLRQYWQSYSEAKSSLMQQFPQAFVATLQIYREREGGKYITMCAWTNFVPTVFPESDYVMLVLSDPGDQEAKNQSKTYIIEQKKLFFLLSGKVKTIDEPTPCFFVDQLDDPLLRQKIIGESQPVGAAETP